VKSRAASWSAYQKACKHRRGVTDLLKEPLRIPSAPELVFKDMVAPGDNSKKVELRIDMIFNADDLQRYDDLYETPELFRGCKSKEHFEQFLELLALGFRLLLACDATAKHPKLFSEIVAGKEIGMNAVTTPATQKHHSLLQRKN
jgi:hypothetical protein